MKPLAFYFERARSVGAVAVPLDVLEAACCAIDELDAFYAGKGMEQELALARKVVNVVENGGESCCDHADNCCSDWCDGCKAAEHQRLARREVVAAYRSAYPKTVGAAHPREAAK